MSIHAPSRPLHGSRTLFTLTLSLIIGPYNDEHVLEQHDERDGPEDERDCAQHVVGVWVKLCMEDMVPRASEELCKVQCMPEDYRVTSHGSNPVEYL